ncbi:TrkH family potassium uptake protein [Flavobacteriaceae bacterium]|nr:TrkH family potassium uptake protein [Flavobacteriaceae bacterium]MDB4063382.1 TrkH family potassium uptake protein [Flavobacteriaceae bacterium]MDB4255414.1 TrkH family potassium uptake protein [Flavobacteriaceae bacterium]MDC1392150.1 TrkH family potassium uptake protein [Flavobacteriaceae bacterium]
MYSLNYKIIVFLMGVLLLFNGGLMLFSALTSYIYSDGVTFELTLSSFIVLSMGALMMLFGRQHNKKIQKREGYLIVSLGWLLMTITGMLPFIMTNSIVDISSTFFETMSGYTATGATILSDIESLPAGILFWRSMTHWIGGMGIIVLAIAILPLLGIGGMQLFSAEAPGPNSDKLHPRITDTAKRLWIIYVSFTFAEALLLCIAGMSIFDAINHAMSTMASGGFSTKNNSLAHWNHLPWVHYIIIIFMFLAGSNFVLSYFAFKGKLKKVFKDSEFKTYFTLILIFSLIVFIVLISSVDLNNISFNHPQVWGKIESSSRHAFFQVISIVTTTGFVTSDYTAWTPFLTIFFFGLMFLGGSAGSTSGGIKVVRHLLMIKGGILELKRALHPNAIIQPRYNGRIVNQEIILNVLAFFILYMVSFITGSLVFGLLGLDFENAIGVAAATLGNVGPAIGDFGPSGNYSELPAFGKFWASFLMLLGRLELFTVLILFTPFFWKKT